MIALPASGPPYEIVPRLQIPDPKNPGKPQFKTDLGRFESDNRELIHKMLVSTVTDAQMKAGFDYQRRFFIVDHDFSSLRGHTTQAHESLKMSVDPFSMPSKNDITALYEKTGMSMPAILKCAFAFEAAIKHKNAAAIAYFGLEKGNPFDPDNGPVVVPTYREVDPALLKAVRQSAAVSEAELVNSLARRFNIIIRPDLLSQFLERPFTVGREGGREAAYLLSEVFAAGIYEILEAKKADAVAALGRDFPSLNCLFENDVKDMKGNGMYCQVLPLELGHRLR